MAVRSKRESVLYRIERKKVGVRMGFLGSLTSSRHVLSREGFFLPRAWLGALSSSDKANTFPRRVRKFEGGDRSS
jgi:hypothetical protein